MNKKDKADVVTIRDAGFIPAGTYIYDAKIINKKFYEGLWTSRYGSYTVRVKMEDCTIVTKDLDNK